MKLYVASLAAVWLGLGAASAHAGDIEAGKAVFQKFNCASCHGADAKTPVDPAYPVLAGQHEDYLKHALKAYQRGQAGEGAAANVRKNPTMGAFAVQLNDEDIANVTAWLASLPSDLGVRK